MKREVYGGSAHYEYDLSNQFDGFLGFRLKAIHFSAWTIFGRVYYKHIVTFSALHKITQGKMQAILSLLSF